MADTTNFDPQIDSGWPLLVQRPDRDLALRVVTARLESYDRIWDLVLGAESEGQGFVPVSAIRAVLTKAVA
jgi:hypothetical protein